MSIEKHAFTLPVVLAVAGAMLGGCNQELVVPDTGLAGDGRLGEIVEYERARAGVPALAGMLVHDGVLVEQASRGVRAMGRRPEVGEQDQWHLGSLTKSMTATVAAVLVERGLLRWDSTVGEVLPEMIGRIDSEYVDVRLEELLSHTAGVTDDEDAVPGIEDCVRDSSPIEEQRLCATAHVLAVPPPVQRGTYRYSNAGYVVAGTMLERMGGDSWEGLMQTLLFTPLGMRDAGFGAPGRGSGAEISQPRGHYPLGTTWFAMDPDSDMADNPPVLGPAGTVHGSLADVHRYLAAHLAGARGEDVPGLLTAESFTKLHTAVADNGYALGWMDLGGGTLWHNGSNGLWFAEVYLNPEGSAALFVACNAADAEAEDGGAPARATNALADQLAQRKVAAFGE